jgi:hypothetical protein
MNESPSLTPAAPAPAPMPVDPAVWGKQLDMTNFVNTYYQYRDVQSLPGVKKILIVGPGQGLETLVLKWRGYEITTFDIDTAYNPDFQGSVHDMQIFTDGQFDAVIASHVVEHLAVPYLEKTLAELSRVARYALIYLPVHGRHGIFRFIPGIRNFRLSFTFDIFNYFEKPDGINPNYMSGMHFWEIGMRGFRVKDMVKRLSSHFEVLNHYRNQDWLPSYNFVLKSRRTFSETES